MLARPLVLLGAAVLLVLPGCAGSRASPDAGAAHSPARGSGIVLTGKQLPGAAGNLLNALRGRLGMQVRQTGACPEITLRGTKSIFGGNSPAVYVDGTRAANTCVLDMLNPLEVHRVEVYPMGVAPRPPYKAHPHGLILVFLENGMR